MTAPAPTMARPGAAIAAMAAILGVFVARPFLPGTWPLMALFMMLLAVGVAWPVATRASDRPVAGGDDGVAFAVASGARRGAVVDESDRGANGAAASRAPVAEGRRWEAVPFPLVVGVGAFALGRLLGGGHPPVAFRPGYVAAVTLAAVAEEAFFRRFVYALLRPGGAALAVAGSAVLFAVAHVTVYGWWVLPLDLAAGLVLSWQRWATGTWAVPAVTHVVANLMVAL